MKREIIEFTIPSTEYERIRAACNWYQDRPDWMDEISVDAHHFVTTQLTRKRNIGDISIDVMLVMDEEDACIEISAWKDLNEFSTVEVPFDELFGRYLFDVPDPQEDEPETVSVYIFPENSMSYIPTNAFREDKPGEGLFLVKPSAYTQTTGRGLLASSINSDMTLRTEKTRRRFTPDFASSARVPG